MKPLSSNWKPCLIAVITAFFFASCSTLQPKPPEVSLTALQLESFSLSHADLSANLRIFNPNSMAVTIERVDYTLLLEDIEIADGRSVMPVRIGARDSGDLEIRLSTAYSSLMQVISGLNNNEVKFSLDGSIQLGGMGFLQKTFPIQRQGTISLKDMALR